MTMASAPLPVPQDVPRTAAGKRNWAWSAVHPGQPKPTAATMPAQKGSFGDLLDVINPLQHIPLVSSAYRALTGDTISGPARILGDTLYGGPLGMAAGIANAASLEASGKDISGQLLAAAFGPASESSTRTTAESPAGNSASASARSRHAPINRIDFSV